MSLFNTFLYQPLYNALIGLIDVVPGGSLGLAVIVLTIIVKLILFPLSAKAIRTQIKIKDIQGDLDALKNEHKDDREAMGKAMLDIYRENKINPFASIILIFIQIPVIIALYFVFSKAGFPMINTDLLYSFIPAPEILTTNFLNFIDLTKNKNALIALFAGVSQYYQMKFAFNKNPGSEKPKEEQTQMEQMMKTMQFQMKFIMPVITFFISFSLVSVIGLYWFVSNLFAIGQELYIHKKIRSPQESQ
jgi:YidC/Oxa1 family membrane protein insertase